MVARLGLLYPTGSSARGWMLRRIKRMANRMGTSCGCADGKFFWLVLDVRVRLISHFLSQRSWARDISVRFSRTVQKNGSVGNGRNDVTEGNGLPGDK
jgi:hypothetical protein